MAALDILRDARRGRKRPIPRLFKPRIELDHIREEELLSRYRLNHESIVELLELVADDLTRTCNRSFAITPITQVAYNL